MTNTSSGDEKSIRSTLEQRCASAALDAAEVVRYHEELRINKLSAELVHELTVLYASQVVARRHVILP